MDNMIALQEHQNAALQKLVGCTILKASMEPIDGFAELFPTLVLRKLNGKVCKVIVLADDDFSGSGYLEIASIN